MTDFIANLIQALKANRYVVLGDPHHGSSSFDSIVDAVTQEAEQKQTALTSALQDAEILLENLMVGEPSKYDDVNAGIALLLKHKIVVTGCETTKTVSSEKGLADAMARHDAAQIDALSLKRLIDANVEWQAQAKASPKRHVIICCGTAHVPRCHKGANVLEIGLSARLAQLGTCVGYAVVYKKNKTDQTYIPEKKPQSADDLFDPVPILEPFESGSDDSSDGDET